MRPLPSPPSPAPSNDSTSTTPPSTVASFAVQFPATEPRPFKARRREGHIFTHSASSSISSVDSSWSVLSVSAQIWMPPQEISPLFTKDESVVMPPTNSTRRTKRRSKPANIIIPRSAPSTTVVSPAGPKLAFPKVCTAPEAGIPRTPLSPLLSPLTPNRRVQTPTKRIRKLARLLGENVPVELVFPSGNAPVHVPPPPKSTQPKPSKGKAGTDDVRFAAPSGPPRFRPRASPASEWPLTPTPDFTVDAEAYKQTAVGLHYTLGMNAVPMRPVHSPPIVSSTPPPFSTVFTVDDVQWERARQAVLGPRTKKGRHAPRGIQKAPIEANGIGAWRKKENTWSGEWNVEDMEELQVRLRRLR
ncbi:hypothetical protein FB45DRAFT_900047 [Roridomyces roridus]|uniref:Uncharacterized protein n=1 Tax=Roridomyces roridus TaxID=1738132 RepID=A0AAD7C819_9AGAR|nr:hypothetical protein FB45DRAFT_900047 [Roridomyces roridus]